MRQTPTPQSIWSELCKGRAYNHNIGLYDTVKQNEDFYIGNHWTGLRVPDLAPITVNVLRRVVSYFVSMLVADDVAVSFTPTVDAQDVTTTPEGYQISTAELNSAVWSQEIERVFEQAQIRAKTREIIRNAAVDGDGYLYVYYDASRGHICVSVLDNTCVLFGNPYTSDIDKQPYILIEERMSVERAKRKAKQAGVPQSEIDLIKADNDTDQYDISGTSGGDSLVTAVTRMWIQDGTVWCMQSTPDVVIRKAWDTKYEMYPIAAMQWERIKNCYHGQAALTGVIPNQIMINKLFSLAAYSVQMTAFPKIVYDATRIKRWSNKPGEAIGIQGPIQDVIATATSGANMSGQVTEIIGALIQNTLEYMGASDAALGNVKPDNTSAIIATQKAAAMPLELQRQAFYQFTEDYVRIMLEIMRVDYGERPVSVDISKTRYTGIYDFSQVNPSGMELRVDVGSSAYWSELMQIQTADNLFRSGIIDNMTYIESIPDKYVKNKGEILKMLEQAQDTMAAGGMPSPDMGVSEPVAQAMMERNPTFETDAMV